MTSPKFPRHLLTLCVSFLVAACGSDPAPAPLCTPGASVACVGAGGCAGGQVCNAAGSGFGACACGTTDAGPLDSGPADGGQADANGPDGGLPCDPFTHAGCAPGERCTWATLPPEPGVLLCVPEGTVGVDGACSRQSSGPLRGTDNCMRGLHCFDTACAALCNPAAPDACPGGTCVTYVEVFSNPPEPPVAGGCVRSCDPVTQQRGDGTPCPPGDGCFVSGSESVCAQAPSTLTHGQPIDGVPFANACAPGFIPGMAPDGSNVCYAHCAPVETHAGAPGGASGLSPHACPDRGAASPPNECRFGSFFSATSDARADRFGICFDLTGRTYDDDRVPGTPEIPVPSCTTLANTDTDADETADHLRWGCAPQP